MYVMATKEHISNPEALACITQMVSDGDDLSVIDPDHRLVRQNAMLRARVLEDRYREIFIDDALQTGHCFLDANRQLLFRTCMPPASFAGLALEAYVVRCINNNMRHVGRLALQWCSLRSQRPRDGFVDKFFAIGTGLRKTRDHYPMFYAPQSGIDVMFLCEAKGSVTPEVTHEPLTLMGTSFTAGIQVKAILGNEMTEIIQPMLANRYLNVLTLLRRRDGMHSADLCMDTVRRLGANGSITELQRRHLERGICRPEEIGLDQREIDWYYEFACAYVAGRTKLDVVGLDALALEVKNWKYSDAGLLIPGSELH